MASGCTPAPSSTCNFNAAADLLVTYTDGHRPVITVLIGGQPARMMVDSGAFASFITPHAFDRLNLIASHRIDGTVSGVTGNMQANAFTVQDLMLGPTTVHNDVLIVSNFGAMGKHADSTVDGLIGEDVLEPFDVAYDLPDNRITLFGKPDCLVTEAPWPGDFAVLPFTFAQNRAPLLPLTIDEKSLPAILDSGADSSVIQQAALTQNGISAESISSRVGYGVGINGRVAAVKREEFGSVELGAEDFSDVWLTVADSDPTASVNSLIGEDFLLHHRIFIANSNRTAFIGLTVTSAN
jgi:predicted aspartyl protease